MYDIDAAVVLGLTYPPLYSGSPRVGGLGGGSVFKVPTRATGLWLGPAVLIYPSPSGRDSSASSGADHAGGE